VSDAGVQQLLLDTNALKTLFNSLPIIGIPKSKPGGEPEKKPSGSYLKLVAAESSKLEVLLKVSQALNPKPKPYLMAGADVQCGGGRGELSSYG